MPTKKELKSSLVSYKTAFYEERKERERAQANNEHVREVLQGVREELAKERGKNNKKWEAIYGILIDSSVWEHIKGWYWHIKMTAPVYVDGMDETGLTGWSINRTGGNYLSHTTDTFRFEDLIRIDVNLEMQY